MDTKKLRYFLAVAETGSFSKASTALHIAQPALSQQIANLEADLGTAVFHRSHRGVDLTVAGRLLREHALKIMASIKRAEEDMARVSSDLENQVMTTMPPSLSRLLARPLIGEMTQRLPDAHLSILDSTSALERDLFLNGHVAFGLLFKPFDHEGIQSIPLVEEPLCLVSPESRASRRSGPIALAELNGQPLILPALPNGMRERMDHAFGAARVRPQVDSEFNSLGTLRNAVEVRSIPTILPLSLVSDATESSKLTARKIVDPEIKHTIFLGISDLVPWRPLDGVTLRILLEVVKAVVGNGDWPGAVLQSSVRLDALAAAA